MNQNPNLFIVFSPLQIINAIEAIHHFDCKNNILIMNYKPCQDKNNEQMDALAKYHQWDTILTIGEGKRRSKFLRYVSLIKKLKKNCYNHIFVAGFTSAIYTILANLEKNKLFFMDDGVGTIEAYNNYFSLNKQPKLKLKHIRFWLFGFKTKLTDKINLFTYFDLKPLPDVAVIPNNLNWFKKTYVIDITIDKDIYFLGHPHDNNPEVYANILEKFIHTHAQKIIYAPHRYEKISKPLKKILTQYDVEIRWVGMPIEIYFVTKKIQPYMVAGFCSSAFFTLKFLYPRSQYQAIYYLADPNCNRTKEAYSHIYSIGIEKITL